MLDGCLTQKEIAQVLTISERKVRFYVNHDCNARLDS